MRVVLNQTKNGLPFFTDWSMKAWLNDLAGRTIKRMDEVNNADLVVMVANAGEKAEAASVIGEACAAKRVQATGLILDRKSATDEAKLYLLGARKRFGWVKELSDVWKAIDDLG